MAKTKKGKLKVILLELVLLYGKIKRIDVNGFTRCCTCKIFAHWTELSGGHFMPQAKGDSTRFELDNINAQCQGCNGKMNQGEQYKHGLYIDKHFGEGRAEELTYQAKRPRKRGIFDLEKEIDRVEDLIVNIYNLMDQEQKDIALHYFTKKHRRPKTRGLINKLEIPQNPEYVEELLGELD